MKLVMIEPELSPAWFPFGDCRPICELRAGAWLIRERWEAIAGEPASAVFGPAHLRAFIEEGVPPVCPPESVAGPVLVGRSDFAPSGEPLEVESGAARLVNDGHAVGWLVPEGGTWNGDEHGDWPQVDVAGVLLRGAYDLVTALEHLLAPDVADFTHEPGDGVPDGCVVIGDPAEVVILGATVEPGVTFDVRQGAVVIEQHAHVVAGTRLEGPVYVGPGSQVLGDAIRFTAIGPRCKVRGEVSTTVFVGYANKGHYGFLGHSVIGRWVNLGAGTTTSDLKNTYGPVRLQVRDARVETGLQFLGSLVGDHAKTAIGTQLDTGTVVGVGASIFGAVRPPKYVRPFAWGDTPQRMARDAFLTLAERVLPRRGVPVTDAVRAMLGTIYDQAVGA